MPMDPKILSECTRLAFANQITFPESIKRMAATGVERYCADLVKLEKYIYSADGQCHVEPMPLKEAPPIALQFSGPQVQEAIKAIQQGSIDYPQFLRLIMKAGVVYYDTFIDGRRVIYTGRNGDFHVEKF